MLVQLAFAVRVHGPQFLQVLDLVEVHFHVGGQHYFDHSLPEQFPLRFVQLLHKIEFLVDVECLRDVHVLQHRNVIELDGQGVLSLDQVHVVDSGVFEIMDRCTELHYQLVEIVEILLKLVVFEFAAINPIEQGLHQVWSMCFVVVRVCVFVAILDAIQVLQKLVWIDAKLTQQVFLLKHFVCDVNQFIVVGFSSVFEYVEIWIHEIYFFFV